MNSFKNYVVYTDGSCIKDKKGGVGIVITLNDKIVYEFSKGYSNTTNNRMELTAIIIALMSVKKNINSLEIISDSQWALNCAQKLWKRKKNLDLWEVFDKEFERTQKLVNTPIKFSWVKGHNSNIFNEEADKLANIGSNEVQEQTNEIIGEAESMGVLS